MSQQELSSEVQEIWALFRKTDEQIEKLAQRQEELRTRQEETGRMLREMSEETDKQIKEVSKQIGDLGGKWGKFVEGMVKPGAKRLFKERGIEITGSSTRDDRTVAGRTMEIDIILSNSEYVVAISVKSTLGLDDVNEHIIDLSEFREFFGEYADKKLIGAVAGIVIDDGVDRYAYRKGLFVIAQSGENITILNDEKFRPKEW